MKITRKEIATLERTLFPNGGTFYDEKEQRYKFIECFDKSIEAVACPGSGKTTCLLAKIILLAEKFPLPDGRGICVLTHTNVAIDEIKNKLGYKSYKLFSYPNHFGTFQTFVDKYITLPFYCSKFKKRPFVIDNDRSEKALKETYLGGGDFNNLRNLRHFLNANQYLYTSACFNRNLEGNLILTNGINGAELNISKPRARGQRNYIDWTPDEKLQIIETFKKLKQKVMIDFGILSFDDAYFLANEMLRKVQNFKQVISNRFAFVFTDEMQDTYPHQLNLIRNIFDNSVIIQLIGDPEQAIYSATLNFEDCLWIPAIDSLKISNSRRFNMPIAKILRTVCINHNPNLVGNREIVNYHPYIITYTNETQTKVLERFAEIIKTLGIDKRVTEGYPIKAIGWVGDGKPNKVTIQNYFKAYNKKLIRNKKNSFNSLNSFLRKQNFPISKLYIDNFYEAVLKFLYLADVRNTNQKGSRYYTKSTLNEYLKTKTDNNFYYNLRERFSYWSKCIHTHSEVFDNEIVNEVRNYFKNNLVIEFGLTMNDKLENFIASESDEIVTAEQIAAMNIFIPENPDLQHIQIEVANVHSVKGETHLATLYLETSYGGKTCSQYIIEQLKGEAFNKYVRGVKKKAISLRMAYVGMSRPKYFLAFAANIENIKEHEIQLRNNNWQIINA